MNKTEAMKQLKANGSAQTVKTYRRHGIQGDLYGVSYAVLTKMKKKIKTDQALAEQLWDTGVVDARTLALMVADPSTLKMKTLNSWKKCLKDRGLAGALSNVVAEMPKGAAVMEKWIAAKDEMVACAGWHTLASLARKENGLSDGDLEKHLKTIEADIHGSKNWVKYAMNNALINIGIRNPKLQKKATAAAKRIGKVEVDHGNTSCKTPDAAAYIKKTVDHYKNKKAKKTR